MDLAIIGAGNVGRTVGQVLSGKGCRIRYGVRDPAAEKHRAAVESSGNAFIGTIAEAVAGAGVALLAVTFAGVEAAIAAAGDLEGKIILDACNPLRRDADGVHMAIGNDSSVAERVQALAPGAAVFKAFNHVGYWVMADTTGFAAPPVMFVCGDDAARKPTALKIVGDVGFHAVDAGALSAARLLEPLAVLWIRQALILQNGTDTTFAYLKRNAGPQRSPT